MAARLIAHIPRDEMILTAPVVVSDRELGTRIIAGCYRHGLSKRQTQIVWYRVFLCYTVEDTAEVLGLAPQTVKNHTIDIHDILGTRDAVQILRVLLGARAKEPLHGRQ